MSAEKEAVKEKKHEQKIAERLAKIAELPPEEQQKYCQYCGEGPFRSPQVKGAHVRHCPEAKLAREIRGEEKERGPPKTVYKGEPDANSVLARILTKHPDITPRIREEVMDWAHLRNGLQPTTLAYLLSNMKGVSSQTANIIAQKYSLALQKAQQEGKIQLPFSLMGPGVMRTQQPLVMPGVPQQQYQYPTYPYGYPQSLAPQFATPWMPMQPQPTTGYPPVPQQPYTGEKEKTEDIVKKTVDEFKKVYDERLKFMEERFFKTEKRPEKETIEVFEPVLDKNGNIITDSKGEPVFRRVSGPPGLIKPGGDPEVAALRKLRMMRDIVVPKTEGISRDDVRSIVQNVMEESKEKLTPEQVVAIVEEKILKKMEETKPKEEPPELKELRSKLAENENRLKEMKENLEAKEKEKLEAQINGLSDQIRRLEASQTVQGYKSDEYRIIGAGLEHVAAVAEKKEPIKLVIEHAPQLMAGAPPPAGAGATPPQRQAPPQARMGLLDILRQRGLVVQQ